MRTKTPSTARLSLLREIPLFAASSDRELATIDSLVSDIEVEPSEILTSEGGHGAETFIVIEGKASVSIAGEHVADIGPGDFVGEMAMIDLRPRTATVRAETKMRLLVVGPADFMNLIQQPSVAVRMLKRVVERLRAAETTPIA